MYGIQNYAHRGSFKDSTSISLVRSPTPCPQKVSSRQLVVLDTSPLRTTFYLAPWAVLHSTTFNCLTDEACLDLNETVDEELSKRGMVLGLHDNITNIHYHPGLFQCNIFIFMYTRSWHSLDLALWRQIIIFYQLLFSCYGHTLYSLLK